MDKNSQIVLNASATQPESTFIQHMGWQNLKSIWPSHQTTQHNQIETHAAQSSTAVPTSAFENGSMIEFVVPKIPQKLEGLTLEMKIFNNSGTDCDLVRVHQLVDRFEWYAGTTHLSTHDYISNYLRHTMFHDKEALSNAKPYTNSTEDFDRNEVFFASGESRTYFLDVQGPLAGNHLVPSLINQDLRLRVYFAKQSEFAPATPTGIELQVAKMMIESQTLSTKGLADLAEIYSSDRFSIRYADPRVVRMSVQMSPGTANYSLPLQNLYGNFGLLFVGIQNQSPTGANQVSWHDEITSITLRDESNQIMLTPLTLDSSYLKYRNIRSFPSDYSANHAIYALSPSSRPAIDILQASSHGVLNLSARGETINIETSSPATLAANSQRQVVIVGYHMSACRIQNRQIIALR